MNRGVSKQLRRISEAQTRALPNREYTKQEFHTVKALDPMSVTGFRLVTITNPIRLVDNCTRKKMQELKKQVLAIKRGAA